MSEASFVGSVKELTAAQQREDAAWPVFLTAEWRNMAMLNFEIRPELLLPHLPAGTTLDLFQGRAMVSVVGFQFLNTRLLGWPVPLHREFPEVNLRFYVRRIAAGEVRRGVVFIKEIVPRRAVACVARAVFHENYVRLPMRHQVSETAADNAGRPARRLAAYRWRFRQRWEQVRVEADPPRVLPPPGSEARFIVEHYWGYSSQPDGSCLEYRVQHPPWRVSQAEQAVLEADTARLYGPEFAEALGEPPSSAFLVDGSEVTVSRGRRLSGKPAGAQ